MGTRGRDAGGGKLHDTGSRRAVICGHMIGHDGRGSGGGRIPCPHNVTLGNAQVGGHTAAPSDGPLGGGGRP